MMCHGTDGRYSPLDTGRAASSQFDSGWLGAALGAEFTDAELLSRAGSDVSFKAEAPLVAVVSSHLLSLGTGYVGVAAQVGSFVGSGLYIAHACHLGGVDRALFAYFSCRSIQEYRTAA